MGTSVDLVQDGGHNALRSSALVAGLCCFLGLMDTHRASRGLARRCHGARVRVLCEQRACTSNADVHCVPLDSMKIKEYRYWDLARSCFASPP